MMKIRKNIIREMTAHALKDAPIEACGYLAGVNGVITASFPMKNTDESSEHYSFDPAEQFKTVKTARGMGLEIMGIYHSHPHTPARMSGEDIRLAYDRSISYMIISLAWKEPHIRSFRFNKDVLDEEEVEIMSIRFYDIPVSYADDINYFEEQTLDFISGKITAVQYRPARVGFGIYEQRLDGTYMVRIRCTAGGITPGQFITVAMLAERLGSGRIHVTTRQELQIHDVKITDVIEIIRELYKSGLSTRGGGGNTVRNITASHDSGISPGEVFDVTPHAALLTSRLIGEPDSWNLPRKFKIGFAGGPGDIEQVIIQDLGFVAEMRDGRRGFRVYAAGGMGAKPMLGFVLHEFIGEEDVCRVTEALKRLFDRNGNRKNKHAARIRFLLQKLGRDGFLRLYEEELAKPGAGDPVFREIDNTGTRPPIDPVQTDTDEFRIWKKRFVTGQKQQGLKSVRVPLGLGDIKSSDATGFMKLIEGFGDNTIRLTQDQNIQLRNIPGDYLGNLYGMIMKYFPLSKSPSLLGNMISCAGANTCRLGICLSRDLLEALYRKLGNAGDALDRISDVRINISGCPNSCGRHHAGDIGFYGKAGRKSSNVYPAYNIVAGASLNGTEAVFASRIGEVSARRLPDFLAELLAAYGADKEAYPGFPGFIAGELNHKIREIIEKYSPVPDFTEDRNYYFDWGSDTIFSTGGIGKGECAAGLFDLIDYDADVMDKNLKAASSATDEKDRGLALWNVVFSASRMLLVTKGMEPKNEAHVFSAFMESFIGKNLIDKKYDGIVSMGRDRDYTGLMKNREAVVELSHAVKALYASMDNSLRFPGESGQTPGVIGGAGTVPAHRFKDLRGVRCPVNFVKTKLELDMIKGGQMLEIYLDDGDPIRNVPASIKGEGHAILRERKMDEYWSVLIEKRNL